MPGGIHPPLSLILSWPEANYINPETRPNTVIILACILGPITVGLLFARLWVRIFHQRNSGWDDWLMLAATVPTIILTVLFPLASSNGFGRHIWDLNLLANPEKVVISRKYILATECIFCFASGLIKVSILLFYRRLSSRVVSKPFIWATWISIGFIVTYSIALTLAPLLGCQPISAFWDQVNATKILQGYKYHCFDEGADVLAASIISAAQDLITAMLPTFLFYNLKIPFRQKLALSAIFAIGYGVVALGVLRAYYSWITFYATYDVTWSTWDIMLTCMLELHIGCLCANAPALKVFFKHFFHEKLTSRLRTRTPEDSHDGRDSAHGGMRYAKASTKLLGNFVSKLSNSHNQRSKEGNIHDSDTGISVNAHGGVHVQRDIQVTHSPTWTKHQAVGKSHASTTTTDIIYNQYWEDGIELGRYATGYSSPASSLRSTKVVEGTDLEALPPVPKSPVFSSCFVFPNTHQQSLAENELPRLPLPAVVAERRDIREKRRKPHPSRTPSQIKPTWQTWS